MSKVDFFKIISCRGVNQYISEYSYRYMVILPLGAIVQLLRALKRLAVIAAGSEIDYCSSFYIRRLSMKELPEVKALIQIAR